MEEHGVVRGIAKGDPLLSNRGCSRVDLSSCQGINASQSRECTSWKSRKAPLCAFGCKSFEVLPFSWNCTSGG